MDVIVFEPNAFTFLPIFFIANSEDIFESCGKFSVDYMNLSFFLLTNVYVYFPTLNLVFGIEI